MQKKIFILLFAFLCIGAISAQAPNGFYVGEVCDLAEANITYYNTPLKIQVDKPLKFKDGHIHSSNNQNDLYRIALEVEKVPENTWLVLKIDESYYATCLRSKKKGRFGAFRKLSKALIDDKVTSDTTNSKGGFVIEKRADADRISRFLKVDIIDRKHFGHQMIGELRTRQKEYAVGDSIVLDFSVENNSVVQIKLSQDGSLGENGKKPIIQFKAIYNGKRLKNKRKNTKSENIDTSKSMNETKTITKGDVIKQEIPLNHWFDFEEPGEYFISWRYKMNVQDMRRDFDSKRAPAYHWDDELKGSFVIKLVE